MKQIDDLAKQALQKSGTQSVSSSNEKQMQQQQDLAKALFQKMRAIFPQKWDSQFSSKEIAALNMSEWASGIAGLTNEQLSVGVERVRSECAWPPSIAEFRALCVDNSGWEHKSPAYIESHRALPDQSKRAKPETVEEHRAKLRKLGFKV